MSKKHPQSGPSHSQATYSKKPFRRKVASPDQELAAQAEAEREAAETRDSRKRINAAGGLPELLFPKKPAKPFPRRI